jgi:hypothetical protein
MCFLLWLQRCSSGRLRCSSRIHRAALLRFSVRLHVHFVHDRGKDLALQKKPAHAGIPGNKTTDSSAKTATDLDPGTWEYTYNSILPAVTVSLQEKLRARQLDLWPEPPPPRGKLQDAVRKRVCTYISKERLGSQALLGPLQHVD